LCLVRLIVRLHNVSHLLIGGFDSFGGEIVLEWLSFNAWGFDFRRRGMVLCLTWRRDFRRRGSGGNIIGLLLKHGGRV